MLFSCKMVLGATKYVFLLLLFVTFIHIIDSVTLVRRKCPQPILLNGRVRVMSKGRTARFKCNPSFQLLGEKYATCLLGRWDTVIPICVKPGCDLLPSLNNGQVLQSYRGAIIKFLCNPGYAILGSSLIYCDGVVWNGTIPRCQASEMKAQTWCDFESQDLCGWTQDPQHNFDWSRQNFQTPSGNVGTGPSFDHTLGPDRGGYYMFIESSSPRMENDTARLYSPVYPSLLTMDQASCFIFWYHMYGATTGSLHVYIKPEHIEFNDALLPRFTKTGDQGNEWSQAIVLFPNISESFQVVIEAVRGADYVSDTAIDDVKVANGSECLASVSKLPSPTEFTNQNGGGNEIYDNTQSCRLRCSSSNIALTRTTATMAECECHLGCLSVATCCADYTSYCMLAASPQNTTWGQKGTQSLILETTTVFESTQNLFRVKSTSTISKPLEKTEVPITEYKLLKTPGSHNETRLFVNSSTDETNKRIPIPTDPTPLILQPPTAIHIPKKQPVDSNTYKSSVNVTTQKMRTVKPTVTTFSIMLTKSSVSISQRLSPELNKSVVTKPLGITKYTAFTKPSLATVFINKKSTSISTTIPLTQHSPAFQPTRKMATISFPPVTRLKTIIKTTSYTTPPIKTTTTRKPKEITEELDYSELSTKVPWPKVKRGQKWIQARRGQNPRMKELLSVPVIVGIVVALITVITVVAFATYFVVRNRRREHRQNYMADDSDVRFLTSDEALDFSLARPTGCGDDDL